MSSITFKKLLNHFEEAVRRDSWKGGGDPDLIPLTEQELQEARKELSEFISKLEDSSHA